MSPELIAILITAAVQISGLVYIARISHEIHTSTRIHVLQGRRLEEVLREMSQPAR